MKITRRFSAGMALAVALSGGAACARQDPSSPGGDGFDYYVLSLSWSPQYCAETRRSDDIQCTRPYAFVAHGLWPQNEHGYPKDCPSRGRVDDSTIDHMLPIMPSRGLIIHEWRTHGACSGLDADRYFSTVEQAYRSVRIPERYRNIGDYLTVDGAQLKRELVASNPKLEARDIALQCSGRYLQEVRVCLDRQLSPRACGDDVRDRCSDNVVLRPMR